MKKILLLSSLFVLAFLVTSCKNSSETKAVETKVVETKKETKMKIVKQTDTNSKEYTSAYICPMHCVGSGSDKPGKCPACHMDYVANSKKADDHSGHDHSGHSH